VPFQKCPGIDCTQSLLMTGIPPTLGSVSVPRRFHSSPSTLVVWYPCSCVVGFLGICAIASIGCALTLCHLIHLRENVLMSSFCQVYHMMASMITTKLVVHGVEANFSSCRSLPPLLSLLLQCYLEGKLSG